MKSCREFEQVKKLQLIRYEHRGCKYFSYFLRAIKIVYLDARAIIIWSIELNILIAKLNKFEVT